MRAGVVLPSFSAGNVSVGGDNNRGAACRTQPVHNSNWFSRGNAIGLKPLREQEPASLQRGCFVAETTVPPMRAKNIVLV